MIISSDKLTRLARSVIRAAGGSEDAAAKVSARLVHANLTGHDSHGVGLLPAYVNGIVAGELRLDAQATVVRDKGPLLLVDGGQGFGQVVAEQAMTLAIARARDQGFALLSLRNSFHIGRIGDWAEMAAEAGFISIHYVNVLSPGSSVAPFGGSDGRFSTNPYCTAIPRTPRHPMFVLDMATSTIAQGKARVAHMSGVEVPEGCLIDAKGAPTRDPGVLFDEPLGALTTMGLHKGFGLALLGDILGGSLSGGGAHVPARMKPARVLNNMLAILIDPDLFGDAAAFYADVDDYADWVKASPPAPGVEAVMFPGDPERRTMAARQADGIPIDDGTWAQLLDTAREAGVPADELAALAGV